ncbi:NUDIX hydrolase [Brucella tritici]|uniref:NUDIX domain-containing protein n=1 Tax=Brucella tritici TaxID=94626 RepID=UPI00124F70A8|nr:NUDIX hydrolase [Brucella tritici]KAB2675823.1 NUDIX hydrolase [Brucella tritici]
MKEIKKLGAKTIYQSRWLKLREDRIRYPDGTDSTFGVVEKNDASMIVPLDDDGNVYLVEQYRYPVGRRFWELPQGSWEGKNDVDPITLARGELLEETGLRARDLQFVGYFFHAYGYSSHKCNLFLARGLEEGARNLDAEEQGLICKKFELYDALRMVTDGEISDAGTIAAFGLLRLKNLI